MARPSFDLEMYAEVDPRIALLNDLRDTQCSAPPRLEDLDRYPVREPARAVLPLGTLLAQLAIAVAILAIGIAIGRW